MAFFRQCWTLTRKNILIALNRHTFSTTIRAFVLPILFFIFLSYAKNIFVPPSTYGIGTPRPIRTLADGLRAASGGRDTIAFVNNGSSEIDRVIDSVALAATGTGTKIARLKDEEELLETCKSSLRGATRCYGAIVFYSSPVDGSIWNYTIRADGAFGEKINYNTDNNDVQIYHLPLQRAVDFAIANTTLPMTVEYLYTSITQAQHETNIRVAYQKAIISLLGVAFLIGMVGITYHLTGFIASERELGMSQLIESMMPNLKRWQPQVARILSYHIAFDLIYLPGWISMAIILGVGVFADTSMAILIVFHLLAGLSLSSFSVFGASFFKKAQLSGITLIITSLLLGVLAQVLRISDSGSVAILSLLFPSANYVFSIKFMARYEQQRMATDLTRAAPHNPWALPGIVLWVFLILQIFVYPVLGAWVERYLYGTASTGRTVVSSGAIETVQLRNFTKRYRPSWFRRCFRFLNKAPKETVVAVNDLTLSASKGQICVLLGANGSGKSTTLDAIAGLNTVTSGSIIVDGTGGLGIAPQKNVLWPELTVEEHIQIFNQLKSNAQDPKETLRALIKAIDLDRKLGAKSKTLSGGQKRKLQLGMMFTGGSAVCCVDEVSSGLDPLSRRKIWDILLAERGSRTIILTTHFLDEADLLADQIAILSKGTLRAQGSSVELKEKLGGGYRIHIQTGPGHQTVPEIAGITKIEIFGQTTYVAPSSKEAAAVIRRLEDRGLFDYQLSGPTIEDVFLQLADEVRAESSDNIDGSTPSENVESLKTGTIKVSENPAMELHTGQNIGFFRQAWVLFRKRQTILRRNHLPYVAAILIPIVGAGLVTLFLKNFKLAGCAPADSISLSDVETLMTQTQYDFALGPSSLFSNATLTALYSPLLPGLPPIPPLLVQEKLNLVDTLADFDNYIKHNFGNVTPAGFFVGSGEIPSTLAYRGNGDVYNAIFGQNIMDVMLTNISIATQYASFDIPWAPSTGKSLQLVVYFGLAMAVYPAFFSLYSTLR